MRVRVKEKVTQILGREDLVGFCASPVVAARATPVRQAPSQGDSTKPAKKSAEEIRPDLLQMLGTKKYHPFQNQHTHENYDSREKQRGIKRDKLKGTDGVKFAVFRRFLLILLIFAENYSIS